MIAAILGDINGHHQALHRCLEYVDEQGIHLLLQSGNLVVGNPGSAQVIDMLAARDALIVQGERDRMLLRFARKRASVESRMDAQECALMDAALHALSSSQLEWLNGLPKRRQHEVDAITFFLCHGSPASQAEVLRPDTPASKLQRYPEMAPVDVLICGGAPAPFDRAIGGTHAVCPGPVFFEGQALLSIVSTEEAESRVDQVRLAL